MKGRKVNFFSSIKKGEEEKEERNDRNEKKRNENTRQIVTKMTQI